MFSLLPTFVDATEQERVCASVCGEQRGHRSSSPSSFGVRVCVVDLHRATTKSFVVLLSKISGRVLTNCSSELCAAVDLLRCVGEHRLRFDSGKSPTQVFI
jgi:hypothetical protein